MRCLEPEATINTFSYIAAGSDVSEEKWVDEDGGQAHEQWDVIIPNGTRTLVTAVELDALLESMPVG